MQTTAPSSGASHPARGSGGPEPANVDQGELAKFQKLASRWWDPTGDFKPLHDINPLRVDWIDRVTGQANAALTELEAAAPASGWFNGARIGAADVATACLWRFGQYYRNETTIEASRYPRLAAHSARAEALEEFHAVPLD